MTFQWIVLRLHPRFLSHRQTNVSNTAFVSTPGNVLLFDCPLELGVHELAALGHVSLQAPGSGHANLTARVGARVLLLGGVIFGHVTCDSLLGQGPVGTLLAPMRLKINIT